MTIFISYSSKNKDKLQNYKLQWILLPCILTILIDDIELCRTNYKHINFNMIKQQVVAYSVGAV